MKFNIKKSELSDALNHLLKAISTKTSIPALEGVLLKSVNGKIEMTAYDLELGIQTLINATVKEDGKVVISAKIFNDIIKKLPNNNIEITVDNKNIVYIKSGNSDLNIPGMDADEFPDLPSIGTGQGFKMSGEILKSMLSQTLFAVADNDARPVTQGSLFNIENNVLDIVSIDGFRLATRREIVKSELNTDFIVPGKTLNEVLQVCSDEEIEIFPNRRHIMFKNGNYIIVSSVIEGEFIDYKNTIPNTSTTEIKVKTKDFIEGTNIVSTLINDRLKSPIRCNFSEGFVSLNCTTALGKASHSFNCHITGPSIEMGFNNKYLLEALKNSECDEVLIKITGSINPIVICPLTGDSFRFLILPVRIRN